MVKTRISPRSVGQIPYYYNHKPSSKHNYVDVPDSPLFCFGHGLSYTKFEYSDIKVNPAEIPVNGSSTISVRVKNTGDVEGDEVVQLYIRDMISSVTTPVKSLKGFKRIQLKPQESQVVTFEINDEHLSLWDKKMNRVVEPGSFKIMIGSSSDDIRQTGFLHVVK